MDSMRITHHEFWTAFHGMIAGAIYLLAFSGGFLGLWTYRRQDLSAEGLAGRLRRLLIVLWTMALISWVTVISGTYVVYPWYREPSPESPRSKLLADSATSGWHTFGMEWKEHVAWLAPILATAAAALVTQYRQEVAERSDLRRATLALYVAAFFAAVAAGLFGAFITKVAPLVWPTVS